MNKKKVPTLFLIAVIISTNSYAQFQPLSQQARDSINKLTNEDHKDMMKQLGITSLRQGTNGNDPTAPNAANYDESKANPFPNLPDALMLKNGKRVKDAKTWWNKRRPEIVEDFDREIYGS